MSAVEDAWRALRQEKRSEAGWHLRRLYPNSPCELFAGIYQPGGVQGLVVEVEATTITSAIRVPASAGFRVETALLGHSHTGRVRIALSLAHVAYSAVFSVLCTDAATLISSQADSHAGISAFADRLRVWQAFMARHGPDGLSESATIGLMGELHVLSEHLAPLLGVARALEAWAGPRGEPNDFSLPGGYLEVKATARQAPDTLSISNANQLDIGRGRILLGHLSFRQSPSGATLPEMVGSFRAQLIDRASSSLIQFDSLLLAAGYIDAHREHYMLRLEPRGLQLFEVTHDFPHIAPEDLRGGVLDCSYSIDLGACNPWAVPVSTLSSIATSDQHG